MSADAESGSVSDEVVITEVLLRDGLQIEPRTVATADKLRIARELMAAGLRSLEVGSFVRPDLVPQLADTAAVLAQLEAAEPDQALHTLVFTESGARRAIESGARSVRFVVSASDGHSRSNVGMSTMEALARLVPAAERLRDADVLIEGSVATAFVCPFDGDTPPDRAAEVAIRLWDLGAGVIHLADTIGAAGPALIRRTVGAVQRRLPGTELGLHLHNTYGMATANAWEGLSLGIRRFDAALGGVGGCPFAPGAAGNLGTDDLVNLLHQAGYRTGIDVQALVRVRDQLPELLGHALDSALAKVPAVPRPEAEPVSPAERT
jgi:hydroxymethylglutaryl-CoA lyase